MPITMPAMIAVLWGGASREGKFGGGGVFTAFLRWRLLLGGTGMNAGRSNRTNETRRFPDPSTRASTPAKKIPAEAGKLSEPKTISPDRLGHPAGRLGVRAPAAAGRAS